MPHIKAAFDLMESWAVPKLVAGGFNYDMLYIGWRHDCKRWWHDKLARDIGNVEIDVLEIFPPNAAKLEEQVWAGKYELVNRVYVGDVRDGLPDAANLTHYDVIFWDHGPEHVTIDELISTTEKLSKRCGILVYSCPWGEWPQGIEDGNENEIHRCSIQPEDLERLGFEVRTVGSSGQAGEGEIVAVKRCS